jgi:hypothetical protein
MWFRLVSAVAIFSGCAFPCDCIRQPIQQARNNAAVVFQGTITSFRDSSNGERRVVFQVNRVWKGHLAKDFEMPAVEGDWCYAFLTRQLAVGNELLVFAQKIPTSRSPDYFPMPCNTVLAVNAPDIAELGRGSKPDSK